MRSPRSFTLSSTTTTTMTRLLVVTLLAVSLASAKPLSTAYGAPRNVAGMTLAPLHVEEHSHGTVNSSYIVMLKDSIHPAILDLPPQFPRSLLHGYVSCVCFPALIFCLGLMES